MLSSLHGLLAWSSLYSVNKIEINLNTADELSLVYLITSSGRQQIASVSNRALLRDLNLVAQNFNVTKITERKKIRSEYSKYSRFVYRINNYPVAGTSDQSLVELTDIKLLNPIIESSTLMA